MVSSQHAEDISIEQLLTPDIKELVVEPELAALGLPTDGYRLLVNPTGKFVIGGPMGDAGLTGRKIIVDTYGGMARHGGGAFSGKDPSKVDRSAAYAMRWVAKNVVAAGLAKRCEVQVAYAIGAAHPVGLFVETFGTGTVADDVLEKAITTVFDLRPGAIVRDLDLLRPIYAPTAAYGHFGRTDVELPWERLDRVDALRAAVGRLTHWTTPLHPTTRAAAPPRWPGSSSMCPWRTWTARSTTRCPRSSPTPCRPAAGCGCGSAASCWTVSSSSLDDATDFTGKLLPLAHVPSGEPVLTPQVARLARVVADRYAGTMGDVLRLALPPRRAARREEADPHARGAARARPTRPASPATPPARRCSRRWRRGGPPRAVWTALPGEDWPTRLVELCRAALSGRRGALVVVPDGKDLDRLTPRPPRLLPEHSFTVLRADDSPEKRYRQFLAASRGAAQVVLGTRAAMFAPSATWGWSSIWDDGDDLHADEHAPYPHARDVLIQRAWLDNCAAVVAGTSRTAEAALLVESGWAHELVADRAVLRAAAPRIQALGDDFELARDPAARSARLPSLAHEAARRALAAGAPVLVQVPRAGLRPVARLRPLPGAGPLRALRRPAGHLAAAGPGGARIPACRWCARPAATFDCPHCHGTKLRAAVVGESRTAEELARAFPGAAVRTSGSTSGVLATVPGGPSLVVATPGAEPVAEGGYGAALLLDSWALLGRADLRAGEETLRRWLNAAALVRPASAGGQVVVAADAGHPVVQALVRWDPGWLAERELADRRELGFPPVTRIASLSGSPARAGRVPRGAAAARGGRSARARCPSRRGPGRRSSGSATWCGCRAPRGSRWRTRSPRCRACGARKKVAEHVRVQLDPLDLV